MEKSCLLLKKYYMEGIHIIMPYIVSKYAPLFLTRYDILKDDSIIDNI